MFVICISVFQFYGNSIDRKKSIVRFVKCIKLSAKQTIKCAKSAALSLRSGVSWPRLTKSLPKVYDHSLIVSNYSWAS